ncbi:hypothetical protein F4604DRAFT_1690780 [Suillus subluteus]|nr:hypothetical protein F4604DRAFT_1690780 [Suillus subluteus]
MYLLSYINSSLSPLVLNFTLERMRYFKDCMYQKLTRLSEDAPPQDGSMTPSTSVCYILNTYKELHSAFLDGAAARQGFEAAFIMCSNIVNEDTSLGYVHIMPSLVVYSANPVTMWPSEHMKAHVYNTTSLATVECVFKVDQDEPWQQRHPTCLILMPGESYNSNPKSKGVTGLTQHEVNVLTHALKAKTMHVVKVTKAIAASKEPIIIAQLCHNQKEETQGLLMISHPG